MSEQEYYLDGQYVTIWGDVSGKPEKAIVSEGGDYGELRVVDRNRLVKKEDSYSWKREQERRKELNDITAEAKKNLDKLSEQLVDKALKDMSSRIKLNVAFGDGGASSYAALTISKELEKMIKEKAPEMIKGKKDLPF